MVRSPEGCLATVSFKKAEKEPTNLRTYVRWGGTETNYVCTLT